MERYSIDEWAGPAPLARAPGLAGCDDVIVAVSTPGFSSDLSSWQLVISASGALTQETRVHRWEASGEITRETRKQSAQIEAALVAELVARAVALVNKPPLESSRCIVEDVGTSTLLVRSGEQWWQVPEDFFDEEFRRLWRDVHLYAPYRR